MRINLYDVINRIFMIFGKIFFFIATLVAIPAAILSFIAILFLGLGEAIDCCQYENGFRTKLAYIYKKVKDEFKDINSSD